jgi:hypothetical protein
MKEHRMTMNRTRALMRWLLPILLLASGAGAHADPIIPRFDDELIELLPSVRGSRAEERQLRQRWATQPSNVQLATELARRYLAQSRELGEPRFAGRALAVLQAWPDARTAPDEVLVLQATLRQHLHDFDGAKRLLELLVERQPGHAQAWLTLATIHRVQGDYAKSDQACRGLARAPQASLHARACTAENQGLRGEFAVARRTLQSLLAEARSSAQTQAWLWTTLADLETRAGRPAMAEQAYLTSLKLANDDYTALAWADLMLAEGRAAAAVKVLTPLPRSDAVALRLAQAEALGATTGAGDASAALRQRLAQSALRPEARQLHAREQALFALTVDKNPSRALELARLNIAVQREPADLLLLARAARAANEPGATREAVALRQTMGLHDARLDALL